MSPSSTDKIAEPSASTVDLERLLNREASAIQRELEVDRILNAFKLKYVFAAHSTPTAIFLYLTTLLVVRMTYWT